MKMRDENNKEDKKRDCWRLEESRSHCTAVNNFWARWCLNQYILHDTVLIQNQCDVDLFF